MSTMNVQKAPRRTNKRPLWPAAPLRPYGAYRECDRCHTPFRAAGTHATTCWHCLSAAEQDAAQRKAVA